MRRKMIYTLFICTLVFAGRLVLVDAGETDLKERSSHYMYGSIGGGCIYATDVEIATEELLFMDEEELEDQILEKSGYELYLMPCTVNGEKNQDNRILEGEYSHMPHVSLAEDSYDRLVESFSQGGQEVVPIRLEVTGGLSGQLVIMAHIQSRPQGSPPTGPEPTDQPLPPHGNDPQTGPYNLEVPLDIQPQEHPKATPEPAGITRIFPRVDISAAGGGVSLPEVEPVGEPIKQTGPSHPATRQQPRVQGKEKEPFLGIVLFSLAGLVGGVSAVSIASDLRIMRWFKGKKER